MLWLIYTEKELNHIAAHALDVDTLHAWAVFMKLWSGHIKNNGQWMNSVTAYADGVNRKLVVNFRKSVIV